MGLVEYGLIRLASTIVIVELEDTAVVIHEVKLKFRVDSVDIWQEAIITPAIEKEVNVGVETGNESSGNRTVKYAPAGKVLVGWIVSV